MFSRLERAGLCGDSMSLILAVRHRPQRLCAPRTAKMISFLFDHREERKTLSLGLTQNTDTLFPAWVPDREGMFLFSISTQVYFYLEEIFE